MNRLSFLVKIRAMYCGQAGSAGQFTDPETGELVNFTEAHAFDFDDHEGNVQRLKLRGSKIVQVSDVDPVKLVRYQDQVDIEGEVVLGEGGARSFFRPTRITRVAKSA